MNILVNVKWGKEKFDAVELNTEEPPMVFKAQLFALTGVQPERQKVMVKGGTLKVLAGVCNRELHIIYSPLLLLICDFFYLLFTRMMSGAISS